MEEYGLTPDELIAKDFRLLRSSRPGFVPHGKRGWIAAIKDVYKRDRIVTPIHLQKNYPHLYDQGVWIFGDWDKALRAAGFDPERTRIRLTWDDEAIIRNIRGLRDRSLPLYSKYVMKKHAGLFHKALGHYGSWGKALHAAGIAPVKGHFPSIRLAVLRALREALASHSKYDMPQALKSNAEYYFGSLRKAVAALKKDRRLSHGWNKPKILKVLSLMHRSKKDLTYAGARRTVPALVSAAEAYFGSWGKASFAAGIDPNLYFVHHTWCKGA
jgi:hypothetical protein